MDGPMRTVCDERTKGVYFASDALWTHPKAVLARIHWRRRV